MNDSTLQSLIVIKVIKVSKISKIHEISKVGFVSMNIHIIQFQIKFEAIPSVSDTLDISIVFKIYNF